MELAHPRLVMWSRPICDRPEAAAHSADVTRLMPGSGPGRTVTTGADAVTVAVADGNVGRGC